MFQPSSSPDLNVLDLNFFSTIQSLQIKEDTTNTEELVAAVQKAYDTLPVTTLNDTFLTLQKVYECVIKNGGYNQYHLPHVGKKKLRRSGQLPTSFLCDEDVYKQGKEIVQMATEDYILFPTGV